MPDPLLVPVPRFVERTGGVFTVARDRTIVLHEDAARHGQVAARRLQAVLGRYAGARWELRAAPGLAGREGVVAAIDPAIAQPEGYHLTVGDERIGIVAADPPGLAHALSTLTQLVRQYGKRIPRLHVEDHPAFRHRGVMLDISRDKVPRLETLFALVDMLSEWKVNEFQLYMEHTFAYERHRAVWKDASPLTGEDVLALDAYCRERHVELVPNQNSFGHMSRWLEKKPYNHLAEAPRGTKLPFGKLPPFTLNPLDPRSAEFIAGLYDELLPHFTSDRINVGCDETFDLGLGHSRDECARVGIGRVYLGFLLKVHALCEKHGRRMMFWGDIIMQHPELIPDLPPDVIALDWGYEHDHPYDRDAAAFAAAGRDFYVCPGAGGWNSLVGRTDNVVANIRNAAANGRAHGAIGLLNTEWGDNGHFQTYPVPWLGFMYGAAMAWSPDASADMPLAAALSLHAYDDPSGRTGRIAYDLGNAHLLSGALSRNGTLPAQMYQLPFDSDWPMHRVRPGGFEAVADRYAALSAQLDPSRMRRPDAQLVVDELRHGARMAIAGANIGAAKHARASGASRSRLRASWKRIAREIDALVPEHERLWLARNRPGGLPDSTARLRTLAATLRTAASR